MTTIDIHNIELGADYPDPIGIDEGFWNTEFEDAVWKQSREMGQKLETYIEKVKDRRIPSNRWLSSLVYAFTKVAYHHKREYKKEDFLSFWKPEIIKANPALDNISKLHYPHKFDRGIGALRELREQGQVPNLIWKPWTSNLDHKTPIGFWERVEKLLKQGAGILIGVGVVAYMVRRKI
jgi:hypothetical protein